MIVAFGILCFFALAFWYVIEDLRDLQDSEGDLAEVRPSDSRAESQAGLNGPSGSPTSPSGRARQVGVDGASSGLGLATRDMGATATVDADTYCTNCGGTGQFYERYLGEWVPCAVCSRADWRDWRETQRTSWTR